MLLGNFLLKHVPHMKQMHAGKVPVWHSLITQIEIIFFSLFHSTHTFKRNERIIQFFQNFDDFIVEDAMWQLSESIKPRGGKKTN